MWSLLPAPTALPSLPLLSASLQHVSQSHRQQTGLPVVFWSIHAPITQSFQTFLLLLYVLWVRHGGEQRGYAHLPQGTNFRSQKRHKTTGAHSMANVSTESDTSAPLGLRAGSWSRISLLGMFLLHWLGDAGIINACISSHR